MGPSGGSGSNQGTGTGSDDTADGAVVDAAGDEYVPAFNAGDSLHPNVAGLEAIADAVDLSLLK